MEKKTKYIIIGIVTMLAVIAAGTFAWLTYHSGKTAMVFTVGDINNVKVTLSPYQIRTEITPVLTYTNEEYVTAEAVNNSDVMMGYTLYYDIDAIDSELLTQDFQYTIERSTNNGVSYSEYVTGDFSTANTTDNMIILDEVIPSGADYLYKVYVWLEGSNGGQSNVQGKSFRASLNAEILGEARAHLVDLSGASTYFKESDYKTKITNIYFVYDEDLPSGIKTNNVKTYNLSQKANMPITGYLINGAVTDTYKLYISSEYDIYATTLKGTFNGMSAATSIIFNNINTSEVDNMARMFGNCSSLTSLDLSMFDTSKVTGDGSTASKATQSGMGSMFYNCSGLTLLNTSGWNTSNVVSMYCMFQNCSGLISLDLSSFNTSNVTNMFQMFYGCSGLTSLNLSSFNTQNVTKMSSMFNGCSSLTILDLSSFNTSNVTDMTQMFRNCSSLVTLDLSGFNTTNVEKMGSMFYMINNTSSLVTLDLSSWDTSNVESMNAMFAGNPNLTTIYVSELWSTSGIDTSSGGTGSFLFESCSSLPNFSSSATGISKAHYNTGGYLTYKAAPSSS